MLDKKIGIIDLGSSSTRLVIYQVYHNGAFKLVDDIHYKIRLVENMVDGRFLSEISMKKALKVVTMFKMLCKSHNIHSKDIIAVATAAVRKAENRERFLKILYRVTGLTFKVLTGEEEALYDYNSVIHSMNCRSGIIVDIGGGSAEIVRFEADGDVRYTSIPLGAVDATERLEYKDSIAPDKLLKLEQYVEKMLKQYEWLSMGRNQYIIGIGGTLRALAEIHRRASDYPLDIIHNYTLKIEEFYKVYDELKTMTIAQRKKVDGLSSERADIIVGGFAILKVIIALTGSKEIIISGNGLREGILFEYMFKDNSEQQFKDVLEFSLNNYMDIYGIGHVHASHIAGLSLSMFEQLTALHKLQDEEKKLLKVAALLHDIGISISYYDHDMHSFYMILNSRLNGLSHREILIIALTAALHHNGKAKKVLLGKYGAILSQQDIKTIQKLSLFLKIAECLDRSETGIVQSIECKIENNLVRMKTFSDSDSELEIRQANENYEAFMKAFNMRLIIT